MNEIKERTKQDILESLSELERLVRTKLAKVNSPITTDALETKVTSLEKKFQSINERNKKVYNILEQVIAELESLLTDEDAKCQQ